MKITLALLFFITALVRADVAFEIAQPEPDNPSAAEVELTQEERDVEDLILKGDASAVAGDQENALSLWGQAYSNKGVGVKQRLEAVERLQWACLDNGIGGSEKPGQAFALDRRNSFLGANEVDRRRFISEFCRDTENNNPHPEFKAYADWLRKMLPSDKNLELLPLILEGDLIDNRQWLSQTLSDMGHNLPKDPALVIKLMQRLGFLEDAKFFRSLSLSEDDKVSVLGNVIDSLLNDANQAAREEVKKHLAGLKSCTIGADLTLALLEKDADKALAPFLKTHSTALTRMVQRHRDEVLGVVKSKLKGYPNTEDMDDAMVALLSPLLPDGELKTLMLGDQLAEALAPEKLVRDGEGDFSAATDGAKLIVTAAQNHPDKAIAGLKKGIKLLEENPDQNNRFLAPSEKPLAALLVPLLYEPSLFSFVLQQADESGLLVDTQWLLEARRYRHTDKFPKLSGEQVVGCFLSSNRLVEKAEGFEPISIQPQPESETILGIITEQIEEEKGGLKEETIAALRAQKSRTFGSEMAEIMISHDQNAVLDFIRRRSPEFEKIPASRRDSVKKALYFACRDLRYTERLSPELQTMLQPLLYHDPIEINRQLQRFMQAPTLASLNLTPKACLQRAQYLLDDVAQLNEGDAYRLAEKVRELIMRHPPNHAGQHSAELKTWQLMTAAVPELFDLYAKEFEKYDGVSKPEWMRHVPYNRTADILPMRWVKMLGKGRFLDEAQSFYSYRLECGGSLHSSLEWIIGQIKGNDAARAAAFDFLNNQNSTFGVELVKALLDGTEDSLLKFFKERAPDLVKIPPERYPELTSLCGLQRASWLQLASVSEKWNNALGPFLPMHKIGVVESCEKLLAVTHLKDLEPRLADLDPSQGDPWLKWLYSISEMMIIDSVKAGRAFEQLLHLAEAADREKMEDQTRNETADKHFYAKNLVIYSSRFPTLLKLCIAVAKTSEKPMHVEALSWGISGMVESPLEACLLVEAAGFLTDAENFDPTLSFYYIDTSSFDGGSGNRMILAFMINDAKQRDSGVRKRLLEYLPQRQPQTFGSDFIQALLEKNAAASVSAFLKVHQDELAKLPAASRKPVMDMLRKAWFKMPKLSAKSSQ